MEILSLGEKIKRKRKEFNMTLKDLAGDRITPGQISLVESGKSNPSMDLLEYLADNLGTSVEYLMESEESQAQKICVYFENMAKAYLLNGDVEKSEIYLEKALLYSEKYLLSLIEAEAHYIRGKIYLYKKAYSLAQQSFLESNVIFMKNNAYEKVIKTLLNLGIITLTLRAYHSSITYFQQAEKLYKDNEIGDDYLIGEIYYFISYNYFKLENVDKARHYCYLAENQFKILNDKKHYAKNLLKLAEVASDDGDMERAIKYSNKSLRVYREIDQNKLTSSIENDLGKLFSEFNLIETSFNHLNRAREMRVQQNDDMLIETLINICENHIRLKNIEKSKKLLSEIREFANDKNPKVIIKYYLLKYRVDLQEQSEIEAENTLIMALTISKNMELIKSAGDISIILGNFYMSKGNMIDASKYLSEGMEIFKELNIIK
ncbi:MAG: tetratricopeptide repeat protein [Clostridium sp.]